MEEGEERMCVCVDGREKEVKEDEWKKKRERNERERKQETTINTNSQGFKKLHCPFTCKLLSFRKRAVR